MVHFTGWYFQGLSAERVPELPDQQNISFGYKGDYGRRLRMVYADSFPYVSVFEYDFIEIGRKTGGSYARDCA